MTSHTGNKIKILIPPCRHPSEFFYTVSARHCAWQEFQGTGEGRGEIKSLEKYRAKGSR